MVISIGVQFTQMDIQKLALCLFDFPSNRQNSMKGGIVRHHPVPLRTSGRSVKELKKYLALIISLVMIISLSGPAFAADSIDVELSSTFGTIELYSSELPYEMDIQGTITFGDGSSNTLEWFEILINSEILVRFEKNDYISGFSKIKLSQVESPWNFSWPCEFEDFGTYDIVVRAAVKTPGDDLEDEDDDTLIIIEKTNGGGGGDPPIIIDYKAAPAVAADLLHSEGVNPNYGKGKSGGNYIADVARFMGPRTDFDGISKSDEDDYRDAVEAFLIAAGAF
jgi:hypothetical protein